MPLGRKQMELPGNVNLSIQLARSDSIRNALAHIAVARFNCVTLYCRRTEMRIFLNDNIRSYALQRGITRYFWHITDGLIKHYGDKVAIFSSAQRDFGPATHLRSFRLNFRGSQRLRLYQITDKWAALASNRQRASVFFSPYYGTSHPKAPEIYVVHDMIHALPEYRANEHPLAVRFRLEVRSCLERAAALIAVSHHTAKDILKCYPHIDAGKIFTIHH